MIEDGARDLFGRNFQTREELLEELKRFYESKGYAISIRDSRKDRYVTIGCDRGGVYRDRRKIVITCQDREASTRLIDCPFQIRGKKHEDGFWSLQLQNSSHNHEPSIDMCGHPSSRRFTNEEVLDIDKMSMSGVQPRQILSSLRQKNPGLQAVARTVYNTKAKIRKKKLDGRSMLQALFDELGHGGFTYNYKHDNEGHLTHVFFSHPKSITLTKTFPNMFVMDCTYKTNRYKMPLLDIVGVSSFNKSFYSCFAFLQKEREEDYIWALKMFASIKGLSLEHLVIVTDRELALMNAIRIVFPEATHILCVWLIQKNVLSKCKGYFKKDDWDDFMLAWNTIVYAETDEAFDNAWALFKVLYMDKKDVVDYIGSTWIPYKERFVSAWTEKHAHFGNRVTSRAEGAHAKLKSYLQVSTGDFRQVRDKIILAIDNEFQEIKTLLEIERIRVPHKYRIPFFKNIVTHVSTFAMNKIYEQYEMAKSGKAKAICIGHFRSTMRLPCAHMMYDWKEKALSLDSVHTQWRIDIRSLGTSDTSINDNGNEIEELTDKLRDKYQRMPTFQKDNIRQKISLMLNEADPTLSEPTIQPHKGRQTSSIKRKEPLNSTRRDPSQFEIVEASLKRYKDQVPAHPHNLYLVSGESALNSIDLNSPSVWLD